MLIHFILVPLFVLNIVIIILLKNLNTKTQINPKKLTYLKVGILFFLWIIYVIIDFTIDNNVTIQLIYIGVSALNFIIAIFIIGSQEKKNNPKLSVNNTWKRCARILNLSFKIRKYNEFDLPIIYGNSSSIYIEIFPFNEEFTKSNNFDPKLKKVISVRIFKKERDLNNIHNIFSYEKKFKDENKEYSYIDNCIETIHSSNSNKIPELPLNFSDEVKKIIDKCKFTFKNL